MHLGTDARAWLVGRYVVMPDHIHLFAGLADPQFEVEDWIKYWKSCFRKQCQLPGHVWQDGSPWHTRMRSKEHYLEKWEYVRNNPVRHGFVVSAEEWPFAGSVHELDW